MKCQFGHAKATGLGEDTHDEKSYGWGNVVAIKRPDNCGSSQQPFRATWVYVDLYDSDSLLMFAISVTIEDIDHGNYRTNKDGWVYLPLKGRKAAF